MMIIPVGNAIIVITKGATPAQVSKKEKDAAIELEWGDVEDLFTDIDVEEYLFGHDVCNDYRDATRPEE